MRTELKSDQERLRNPMTVRWADGDLRLVADSAWQRRMSTSELVRQLVLEALGRKPADDQPVDGNAGDGKASIEGAGQQAEQKAEKRGATGNMGDDTELVEFVKGKIADDNSFAINALLKFRELRRIIKKDPDGEVAREMKRHGLSDKDWHLLEPFAEAVANLEPLRPADLALLKDTLLDYASDLLVLTGEGEAREGMFWADQPRTEIDEE